MRKLIRRLWVVCGFTGAFLLQSHAQSNPQPCNLSLSIQVIDEHNSETLEFAIVKLEPGGITLQTDENGKAVFQNLCPGQYRLLSRHIGCADVEKTLDLKKNASVKILQEHHEKELEGFEISALKKLESPAQISLRTYELDRGTGKPLGTLLTSIPGVQILSTGNAIAKPVVHGLHSNRVLTIQDQVRFESQQWGSEHAPETDPLTAGQVNLLRGPDALRYGPDALGGAIEMEAAPLRDSAGINGKIQSSYNTNGKCITTGAMTNWVPKKVKGLSMRFQSTWKKGGDMRTPTYYLDNTMVGETNYHTKIRWQKENMGAEFSHTSFQSVVGILAASHTGNLTDLKAALARSQPFGDNSFNYNITGPWQNLLHETTNGRVWVNRNKTTFRLNYSRQFNQRKEFDKTSLGSENPPDLQFNLTTHQPELTIDHKAGEHLKIRSVASTSFQKHTYDGQFFIPNYLLQQQGIFSDAIWQKGKWKLSAGVRADRRILEAYFKRNGIVSNQKSSYSGLSGAALAQYSLEKSSFFFQASRNWRNPSVNELYSRGLHDGAAAVETGDPDLKSENGFVAEFGWAFRFPAGISGNLLAYTHNIKNFIQLIPEPEPVLTIRGAFPAFRYQQIHANISGLDAQVTFALGKIFEFESRASLITTANRFSGEPIWGMPQNQFHQILRFQPKKLVAGKIKIMGSVTARTVAQASQSAEIVDFASPPAGYTIWAAEISGAFTLGKTQFLTGLTSENLTNIKYRDYLSRLRYFANNTGREIQIFLAMNFNNN